MMWMSILAEKNEKFRKTQKTKTYWKPKEY